MKVTYHQRSKIYEIHGKESQWWTAAEQEDGTWLLMSGRSHREVRSDGLIGKKIIEAVELFKKQQF
jgi:hypothetical protein